MNYKHIGYITLVAGLLLSANSAYYSVIGFMAFFSGASTINSVVLGVCVELGKIALILWLHKHWQEKTLLKLYAVPAVFILVAITSISCYSYLNISASQSTLAYDEMTIQLESLTSKLDKSQKEYDAAVFRLDKMNSRVDGLLAKGNTTNIKKSLSINENMSVVSADVEKKKGLLDQAISEYDKVNTELQSLKLGDAKKSMLNDVLPDSMASYTTTIFVLLLLFVFDPLAITLLIASQHSFGRARESPTDTLSVLGSRLRQKKMA